MRVIGNVYFVCDYERGLDFVKTRICNASTIGV